MFASKLFASIHDTDSVDKEDVDQLLKTKNNIH